MITQNKTVSEQLLMTFFKHKKQKVSSNSQLCHNKSR